MRFATMPLSFNKALTKIWMNNGFFFNMALQGIMQSFFISWEGASKFVANNIQIDIVLRIVFVDIHLES